MKASKPSHVIFRKESGWTPKRVHAWLCKHAGGCPVDYEEMNSKGGKTLKPGSYIVVRVAPKSVKFTSYGYGEELKNYPGVWFKFGGCRR